MKAIVSTPDVINGNPRIDGSRVSVLDVVSACSVRGMIQVLEDWPEISKEDVIEAIRFCEARECNDFKQYCGGCALRNFQDGIYTMKDFINRFEEVRFIGSDDVIEGTGKGVMIMPERASTFGETWKGIEGWKMARRLREGNV